jgi:tRNA(Ile)-lysidine synthetase-like protein
MEELYCFWFTDAKPYYFNQSDDFDHLIEKKYKKLLESHKLHINPSKNDFVAEIILYDQIPRHIYRGMRSDKSSHSEDGMRSDKSSHSEDTEIINRYNSEIINYINEHYRNIKNELNAEEFSFVLLPLRHTNNFNYLCVVLRETWNRIKKYPDEPQYKRFLEASYKRYLKFNDDMDNLIYYPAINNSFNDAFNIYDYIDEKYLDKMCHQFDKKVKSFDEIKDNDTIKDFITKYKITDCIISLSGGVDSMLLSYFLKKCGINVYALHINYLNRDECEKEENIIIQWTTQIGIPLFIRQIDEIKRKPCMDNNLRELYENYTRDIRFQSYRNVIKKMDIEMPIFLGHNKDDCFENILTNIVSKSHYDNLWGMDDIVTQGDLVFARPMLSFDKKYIYDTAIDINIPFFVDSTPKWSQRGKIRDIVRPTLESWNPIMVDSLFYLTSKSI